MLGRGLGRSGVGGPLIGCGVVWRDFKAWLIRRMGSALMSLGIVSKLVEEGVK